MVYLSGFHRCTAKLKLSKGDWCLVYWPDTATFGHNLIGSE